MTAPQRLREVDAAALTANAEELRRQHAALVERGLSLNLTRGKPATDQLDLAEELLERPGTGNHTAADGTDCRNYGGLLGLAELRELFSPVLGVPAAQLVAEGNASLALMHQCVVDALLHGLPGGQPWRDTERVAFLCPVPGYDRHFSLCQHLGIEMIPVGMTEDGPDLDAVAELLASDERIKGMWCVPVYSNPTGVTYSADTVRRLVSMPAAAPDFRLFWDNAYAVHDLTETAPSVPNVLELAAQAGNPDRPFVFGSTSKITMAGAGVAFFGASKANVDWYAEHMRFRTIGPDKINQLRHVQFLGGTEGLRAHMAAHRALLAPKFAMVDSVLHAELDGAVTARWSKPAGGYFISLDVLGGCAARVIALAKQAGIALTPAGATFPYGRDPQDANIRIAPTFPDLDELEAAVRGLTLCVKLAEAEKRLAG
ncbi:MAG: aminotransferase class I/II-fold pyridoxal phosphate-dependent enzyme [Sciscionella sp.]